jgi:ectoine hydroxylase-related dioxygenase (phytanoyl-CoA dioxygenase family)
MGLQTETQTGFLLSPEQLEQYRHDGYLVVPDLLTPEEIDAFLQNEETAPAEQRTGGLRRHTVDPAWRAVAMHPRIAGMLRQLLEGEPEIVQTMYMNKQAGGGKGIALHQDRHYIAHEPYSLMACWIAFSDTGPDNGGLCVVPGSHRGGLRPAHKNEDLENHTTWETEHTMRDRDGREWTETLVSFQIEDIVPEEVVHLTVPRGGGVFFTSQTIHGSFANRSSDKERLAFATHYVRKGTWVFRTDIQDLVPVEATP